MDLLGKQVDKLAQDADAKLLPDSDALIIEARACIAEIRQFVAKINAAFEAIQKMRSNPSQ